MPKVDPMSRLIFPFFRVNPFFLDFLPLYVVSFLGLGREIYY